MDQYQCSPRRAASHRAASLVYTIIIVTVMLVTVSSVVDSILRANRQYEDFGKSDQAEKAARALMERAFLEATTATDALGYETASANPTTPSDAIVTQNLFDTNGDGTPDVYGTYEIWARAKKVGWRTGFLAGDPNYGSCGSSSSDLCVVPIPGTGNAGSECDFTDVSQGWAPSATVTAAQALDNDCNWNKLHYGEVVSFPLYYEDAGCTGGICNPAEAPTLNTFTLRVRTPDTDGDGIRETLNTLIDLNEDGDTADSGENDPVVVNWEITGDCDTNGVFPEEAEENCWMIGREADPSDPDSIDSFIYTDDVNTAVLNEVLQGDTHQGQMHNGYTNINILNFLTGTESNPATAMEILNPLLTISVVSPLENAVTLDSVPYLEYQIQVDKPISDNKSSIHTVGKAEGKLGTYVWPLLDYLGIAENPLIQFVIQN